MEILNFKKLITLEVTRPDGSKFLAKYDVLMVQKEVGELYIVKDCARSTDDTAGWWNVYSDGYVTIPESTIQSKQVVK